MKAFVLFGCVLACVVYISAEIIPCALPGQPNNGEELVNDCLNEVGLTREDSFEVEDIINEVYKQPEMEEKKRKHGCVSECLLKKLDWLEGSEIKEERIYGNITKLLDNNHPVQEKAQELVRTCAEEVRNAPEEGCEKGFTALICTIKNMQEWKHLLETLDLFSSEEEGEEN